MGDAGYASLSQNRKAMGRRSEFSIGRFRAPTVHGENWYFALTMRPVLAIGEISSNSFTVNAD